MSQLTSWPDHLLTLEEWDALPEDLCRRSELVEGVLLVVPKPARMHQRSMANLCAQLNRQLPPELTALPDVDVVIASKPLATVRAPDVVILRNDRAEDDAVRLTAADVLVAIEIVSPGSGRTDRVTTLAEYADAGIPTYWIIELGPPVTLSAFSLVAGAYQLIAQSAHQVAFDVPAPLQLDLTDLLRR